MSSVFIINKKPEFDYADAKKYGELVVLSTGLVNIYKPEEMARNMQAVITQFKAGDYLLLAGNALPIFLAGMYVANNVKEGPVNILIYDIKYKRYVVHSIDVQTNAFANKPPQLFRTREMSH